MTTTPITATTSTVFQEQQFDKEPLSVEAVPKDISPFLTNIDEYLGRKGRLIPFKMKYRQCYQQHELINFVFSVAAFAFCCTPLVTKLLQEKLGNWLTRSFAALLLTTGTLLMATSTVDSFYYVIPAMCFTAMGGAMVSTSNQQFANLYLQHKLTIRNLLDGATYSSAVVFLLMRLVVDKLEVSVTRVFLVYSVVPLLVLVRTFCMNTRPLLSLAASFTSRLGFSVSRSRFGFSVSRSTFHSKSRTSSSMWGGTNKSRVSLADTITSYNRSLIKCIKVRTRSLMCQNSAVQFYHT